MNKELQRIAIAKQRGFTFHEHVGGLPCEGHFRNPAGQIFMASELPNYPKDLRAMHEAETGTDWGVRGNPTWETYVNALSKKVRHPILTCCADAEERCETYVRVMGLWETPATNKEENASVEQPALNKTP